MRPIGVMCGFLALFFSLLPLKSHAADTSTPAEVIQKVREAADFMSKAGDAGLAAFSDKTGKWVWKDTYVWVLKCGSLTDAAHPFNPKLVGLPLGGMKDAKGNYFFVQLCEKAQDPRGAWVEYWWPKVGEKQPSRKISYILGVPNTPYQVAAGIYDENISLEELDQLLK